MADGDHQPEAGPDLEAADRPRRTTTGWGRLGRTVLWVGAVMIVVVTLLEGGVRLIDQQLPPVDTDDSQELVLKAEQVDALAAGGGQVGALVFGSSTMDSGISPAALDAASTELEGSYNAALIATPLSTQERWADEVVLDELDPELVILGVNPFEVRNDAVSSELAPVDAIFDASFREVEEGPLAALERWATDRSALVRYRGSLRHPRFVADAVRRSLGDEEAVPRVTRPDGYWEQNLAPDGAVLQYRDRTLGPVSDELVRYLDETMTSPYAPETLEDLLDRFEDDDLPVVVVAPPIALAPLAAAGLDRGAYLEGVEQLGETVRERGFLFVDLSEGYGAELFADPLHLNATGTLQLSQDVAATIDAACADAGCRGD